MPVPAGVVELPRVRVPEPVDVVPPVVVPGDGPVGELAAVVGGAVEVARGIVAELLDSGGVWAGPLDSDGTAGAAGAATTAADTRLR